MQNIFKLTTCDTLDSPSLISVNKQEQFISIIEKVVTRLHFNELKIQLQSDFTPRNHFLSLDGENCSSPKSDGSLINSNQRKRAATSSLEMSF